MLSALKQPIAWLFATLTQPSRRNRLLWLGASLAIATYYGWLVLQQAFAGAYVVQDDARQHVFWMQRFTDPELFPNDLIADYFQGVAPFGYTGLYRLAAALGIPPHIFSKILPPILGVLTAWVTYEISWALLPVPLASFIASVSFSQSLAYSDELSSATPRAFLYPLLLAFLYFLIRQKPWLYVGSVILLALFYPQVALICLGILAIRLIEWQNRRLWLTKDWAKYGQFAIAFGAVAAIVLLSQTQPDFGPVISRAEAMSMPEFQIGGRNVFFTEGLNFWLHDRAGLFHRRGFTPATIIAGALLPILLWMPVHSRWRSQLNPRVWVLFQLLIASLGLFFLAHLLLFQLHLPSRYASHSIRAILALACGISWVIILDDLSTVATAVWRRQTQQSVSRNLHNSGFLKQSIFVGLSGILLAVVLVYPVFFLDTFPKVGYYDFSENGKLYEYFAAQPKDSMIASVSVQTGNIPTFSGRSVLVSPEHAIAYHTGFYEPFRQRTEALINAQYATDPAQVSKFISTYSVDFWLIDNWAFQPEYIQSHKWLLQYQPMADNAAQILNSGSQPILQQALPLCTLASTEAWTILEASCVDTFAQKMSDRPPKAS